ncbi:MAG: hypothetical protein M1836_005570 [Candelina mexicana]|nr:MAG: hypothetical protein M1836_005570 [Candelina mexicana]
MSEYDYTLLTPNTKYAKCMSSYLEDQDSPIEDLNQNQYDIQPPQLNSWDEVVASLKFQGTVDDSKVWLGQPSFTEPWKEYVASDAEDGSEKARRWRWSQALNSYKNRSEMLVEGLHQWSQMTSPDHIAKLCTSFRDRAEKEDTPKVTFMPWLEEDNVESNNAEKVDRGFRHAYQVLHWIHNQWPVETALVIDDEIMKDLKEESQRLMYKTEHHHQSGGRLRPQHLPHLLKHPKQLLERENHPNVHQPDRRARVREPGNRTPRIRVLLLSHSCIN